jgi:hypothetical protein
VRSVCTAKRTGTATEDVRYFLSSAAPAQFTPRQWLARIRGHWMVETGNHYRRDATWHEDGERSRSPRCALNKALLRDALLGRLLRDGSINLRATHQHFAARPTLALRFVLHHQPAL